MDKDLTYQQEQEQLHKRQLLKLEKQQGQQAEQGRKMSELKSHPYWGWFEDWLKASRDKMEHEAHNPAHRAHPDNYAAAIRALERFGVYDDIIKGTDQMIRLGEEAQKQLIKENPSGRTAARKTPARSTVAD